MNFKPQILAALKTKFTGVDERILGRVADKLAKTVTSEEQVATSVEGVTFQSVLESHGDSCATDASQTAVSNYEKKHNLKDGKPTGGDPVEPNNTDPTPQGGNLSVQITAAVTAAVKPLQEELATFKTGKVSEIRIARQQRYDSEEISSLYWDWVESGLEVDKAKWVAAKDAVRKELPYPGGDVAEGGEE